MRKRWVLWIGMIVLPAVWVCTSALMVDAQAMGKKPGLSQTEIKEKGKSVHEKGKVRWESLTPDEQAYVAEKGKERAAQAKMTAEQYWNSLSEEEQEKLLEGKERVSERARERWQKKSP